MSHNNGNHQGPHDFYRLFSHKRMARIQKRRLAKMGVRYETAWWSRFELTKMFEPLDKDWADQPVQKQQRIDSAPEEIGKGIPEDEYFTYPWKPVQPSILPIFICIFIGCAIIIGLWELLGIACEWLFT